MALYKLTSNGEIHKWRYLFPHVVNISFSVLHYIIDSDILAITRGLVLFKAGKEKIYVVLLYIYFMYIYAFYLYLITMFLISKFE